MNFIHKNYLIITGLSLLSGSMFLYLYDGYSILVLLLWFLSMVSAAVWFRRFPAEGGNNPSFTPQDFLIAVALTAVISVFYLSVEPTHPMQMVGDEIQAAVKSLILSQPGVDMFKPIFYFNFQTPFFAALGHIANLFGPIDVITIRLVHTIFGIALSAISFFFFRLVFSDRFYAILATLLLAVSPTLFGVSHITSWNNSAVFMYILSVLFLLIGLRKGSQYYAFIGGFIAALGWYVYSPSKIIIFIWLATLAIIALLRRFNLLTIDRIKYGVIATLIGFGFGICPFVVGALVAYPHQEGDTNSWHHLLNQHMFSYYGRKLNYNNEAVSGPGIWYEDIFSNAYATLTVFNVPSYTKDAVYHASPAKRFVDPLSGVLLWIGVLFTVLTIRRQRIELITHTKDRKEHKLTIHHQRIEMVVVLLHFLLLFFVFMFVINFAPHFVRLLIILPFFIPLVIVGSLVVSRVIALLVPLLHNLRREVIDKVFLGVVCCVIVFLSVGIFGDYARWGILNRGPKTDALRYIHDQSKSQQSEFYLFDHQMQSYYLERWDDRDWQRVWINLFIVYDQPPETIGLKHWISYEHEYWDERFSLSGYHGEPIANTLYYIVNQASRSPHIFYLIKDYQKEKAYPDEFKSRYNWDIWVNLFTVFKQPFGVIEPEDSLITQEHKFPRTFFVPDYVWNDMRDRVLSAHRVVDVHYLSSRKNLLIVRVGGSLDEE